MPSAKQLAAFAVGALALILVVWVARSRRVPPTHPVVRRTITSPAPSSVMTDAAVSDVEAVVDVPPRRAVDVPTLTLRQRLLGNRQRDVVAARVFRELVAQRDRGVVGVQAVDSGGGVRDTLRVRAATCDEMFSRQIALSAQLQQAGFSLISCVRPGTRDTFQTGVSAP